MQKLRRTFVLFFLGALYSCNMASNFQENISANLKTKKPLKKTDEIKTLIGTGEFVNLKNRKHEIFFMDIVKPKGYFFVKDSLDMNYLVKRIIINDTLLKN